MQWITHATCNNHCPEYIPQTRKFTWRKVREKDYVSRSIEITSILMEFWNGSVHVATNATCTIFWSDGEMWWHTQINIHLINRIDHNVFVMSWSIMKAIPIVLFLWYTVHVDRLPDFESWIAACTCAHICPKMRCKLRNTNSVIMMFWQIIKHYPVIHYFNKGFVIEL